MKSYRCVVLPLVILAMFFCIASPRPASADLPKHPNVIIIFVDDMGYADIGPFGSTLNRTPNLDRMADEGMCLTSFYSSCSVCSPSRASLMTGCYPKRVDLHCNEDGLCVLFPGGKKGLNPEETTIAELLKTKGYHTKAIGKWHLGDQPEFLPTRQGFDSYYGIPYSNDMSRKNVPLPLMRDDQVFEQPCEQDTVTQRYTKEAVKFIEQCGEEPFFLYLPQTMVHVPLHVSDAFRGKSANGLYGDAVEEIDWSTGEILDTLKKQGLDKRTLVVFTSDNGGTSRGKNTPLRGFKGQTYEGGMREPCVAWWPGVIPAGSKCDEMCGTIDLLPTIARLAGVELPEDHTVRGRKIDGRDIRSLLLGEADAKSPHEAYYYYQLDQLQAVRDAQWKLFLPQKNKKKNWGKPTPDTPVELYDLKNDIGETTNVATEYPEIVERLTAQAAVMRRQIGDTDTPGSEMRKAGYVENPTVRLME